MKKSCVACGAEDKPLVPLTNSTPLRVMEMNYDLDLGICFDCLVARLDLEAINNERMELICQGKLKCPEMLEHMDLSKLIRNPKFTSCSIETLKGEVK